MRPVHFRPDLNVGEREQELKKLCISEKESNFSRTLTDNDVDKEKHNYAEKGGELKEKKAERKAAVDSFNGEISALEKLQDEILERIQTRKRKVYDKLYGVANYNNGLMEYFDKFGEMIDSRKLTPDEATGHLFNNDGDAIGTAPAEKKTREIGFEAGNVDDGQGSEDIQDAEFEEVKDDSVAQPTDEEPSGEPAADPDKTTKKKTGTRKKKDDEPKAE